MAFWKKSEDPWDRKPEKRKPASVPPEETQTPPPWVHVKKPPVPMNCPWCGQLMLAGNLYGSMHRGTVSGMDWREGEHKSFLETLGASETGRYLSLGSYEEAWYCEACQKMVLDVGLALKRSGPNYVWKDGKVVFPEQEETENQEL